MKVELTDSQHFTIEEALRTAAETYRDTANSIMAGHGSNGQEAARIVENLRAHADECDTLRDWWAKGFIYE